MTPRSPRPAAPVQRRRRAERVLPHLELMRSLTYCGITYQPEYAAIEGRRFRFDLAIPRECPWLLVEVHGGVFIGGRHTRGKGFTSDRQKMNLAMEAGYEVREYTSDQVRSGEARAGIERAIAAHERQLTGRED